MTVPKIVTRENVLVLGWKICGIGDGREITSRTAVGRTGPPVRRREARQSASHGGAASRRAAPERPAGTIDRARHDPCKGQVYGAASRREKARLRGGHPPHGTEAPAHTDGSLRLSICALSAAPGPRRQNRPKRSWRRSSRR